MTIVTPLNESQKAVVDLLEETLKEARKGNIFSIGVVVCMKSGYAHVMAGTQAADLNMGCDSLKRAILETVENAGVEKMTRSNIIRVK